jgi:hypothetical protein
MTLVSVWIAYSFNWIRQRRAALAESCVMVLDENAAATAPWLLFLFGERGCRSIGLVFDGPQQVEQFARLKSLFPEAEVSSVYIEPSPRPIAQPWPWTGPVTESPQAIWGQTLRPQIDQ